MLYREIIAVCSQIHIKYINTLCVQKVEFVIVKPRGTYGNNLALKVMQYNISDWLLGFKRSFCLWSYFETFWL